jgi:hypothetical protein
MQDSESKADWMSFVLHFLFGFAVGAGIGFFVTSRRGGTWLQDDLVLPFLSGTALLAGGVGARWGDRLWMSFSESTFGSDAPRHNRFSKWLCNLSILAGIAFSATSLFKQFSS